MDVRKQIKDGFVLLDGAMGTMLQPLLRPGERPEILSVTHPEEVEAVHRQYLEAGSDLVYTNTFGANAHKLKGAPCTVEQAVAAAVSAAKRAAGEAKMVALDLGSLGEMLEPAGTLSFDDAYALFRQQVLQGSRSGADCVVIETMSDLNEVRAAVLAAKENSSLPILVSMTFEPTMRTFTGCPVSAMGVLLEGLGVDALGVNCSLGPQEIFPIARELARWTSLPLLVKPNAGLPDPATGEYPVGPEDFAKQMESYLPLGVRLLGGCCGTTPAYLASLRGMLKNKVPAPRAAQPVRALCTATAALRLEDQPLVIGSRMDAADPEVAEAFATGDFDTLFDLADEQRDDGAGILLLQDCAGAPADPGAVRDLLNELQGLCPVPLAFSFTRQNALEAALRGYCGKALVLLPAAEKAALELCRFYGASVAVWADPENPSACFKQMAHFGVREADRYLVLGEWFFQQALSAQREWVASRAAEGIPPCALILAAPDGTDTHAIEQARGMGVRLLLADPGQIGWSCS